MLLDEADVLVRLGHGENFARRILLCNFLPLSSYKKLLGQNLIMEEKVTSKIDGKDEKFYQVKLTEEGKNFIRSLKNVTEKELSLGIYELGWLLRIGCGNVREFNIWMWTPCKSTVYCNLKDKNYIEVDSDSKYLRLTPKGEKCVSKIINKALENSYSITTS
ncbi:MAG: hypothetical protein PHO01_09635 [Desulfotomaculaceae bacterium]|nr:hypothetical protein [Desulfotomaculaceae bacterium]